MCVANERQCLSNIVRQCVPTQCVTSDYAVGKTFHHGNVKPEYLIVSRMENEMLTLHGKNSSDCKAESCFHNVVPN